MKLTLPAGNFRAFLFDCDGTVVDSMPIHYSAWKRTLAEWKCDFPEDLFYSWGGKPIREIVASLNEIYKLEMPLDTVSKIKEEFFMAELPNLQVIDATVSVINEFYGKIPFAVASGGRGKTVNESLRITNLLSKFETIVGAEDYVNSKPAPDCYLEAARRLGVDPKDCLVFEDTDMGIESATNAGMASVKVPIPERN